MAKKGWRILQSPDSLVAKVLQARYFKNKDFFNVKLGLNHSFIWRSIICGSHVIKNGSRWRIEDGHNVKVYKENWLLRPLTFRPISKPTLPTDTLVSELINDENQWNERLIYNHFDKMDVDRIVSTPLPRRPMKDQLLWHYQKRSQYTVKSGY